MGKSRAKMRPVPLKGEERQGGVVLDAGAEVNGGISCWPCKPQYQEALLVLERGGIHLA